MINKEDVTVVVRSSLERTLSLCVKLLKEELGEIEVFVTNEAPFSKALKKSFEIGIEEAKEWTLIIDADVLVQKGALKKLLNSVDDNINAFEYHTYMIDKFFGGKRPGGAKLYRTSLLIQAVKLIADEKISLRPETFVIKQMGQKGFKQVQTNVVVGLHDFEQFYEDIFRKTITHAKKHSLYIPILKKYWDRKSKIDNDFRLMLLALQEEKKFESSKVLDKGYFNDRFSEFGIKEKEEIDTQKWNADYVTRLINQTPPPREYYIFNTMRTWHNIKNFLLVNRK